MARNWNWRQFFAKTWHRTPVLESADESLSLARTIHSGDFNIDLAARTVTLRGQELSLSPEEFDVLVFLANHPQHLVTPHTVLATASNSNRLRHTEFLRALMGLRKKLDSTGHGGDYLRTEPWILYRFSPTSSSAA